MSDARQDGLFKEHRLLQQLGHGQLLPAIWGGESIHVGIFDQPGISIRDAARRAVTYLAGRLDSIGPDKTVIDLGSGFGGPIRQLVADYGYGCRSERQRT